MLITKYDQILARRLREEVATLHRNLRRGIRNTEQLSLAEENVVGFLVYQPGARPSELSQRLKMSSQFVSQVLNRLHTLGFICRRTLASDKRISLISLTERGKHLIELRRREKEDLLAALISDKFTNTEKRQIASAIDLLTRLHE